MEMSWCWKSHRARIKVTGNQFLRVIDDKCLTKKPERRVHMLGEYLLDYM